MLFQFQICMTLFLMWNPEKRFLKCPSFLMPYNSVVWETNSKSFTRNLAAPCMSELICVNWFQIFCIGSHNKVCKYFCMNYCSSSWHVSRTQDLLVRTRLKTENSVFWISVTLLVGFINNCLDWSWLMNSVACLRKALFEFHEALLHLWFEKSGSVKAEYMPARFPRIISMWKGLKTNKHIPEWLLSVEFWKDSGIVYWSGWTGGGQSCSE